jgi:MGT family glycosyltransferase
VGRFLFVTWDGGGNVPPALVLARRLRERGHLVRILAPRTLRLRIESTGSAFRAFPRELEWDESNGRALEDQLEFWTDILAGTALAEAVLAEIEDEPPDVIVVDCMLENALAAAELHRLPTAALVHVLYRPWAAKEEPSGWWEDEFNSVNDTRAKLGLAPIPRQRFIAEFWARPDRALVLVPREFDEPGSDYSPNVRYVGPVLAEADQEDRWDLPWPPDDPGPLILVSLSTTYQHQEDPLCRVLEAVASVPGRRLLSLARGIESTEVEVPNDIVVRDWVSHAAVLPHTSVVITHAGLGTVSAALAHGVPLLCLPLGREQPNNARRVEACGAGRIVAEDASPNAIREALADVLDSDRYRKGAERMAAVIAEYGRSDLAMRELEGLLTGA